MGSDAWNARASRLLWSDELCASIDLELQGYYVVHPLDGQLYLAAGAFELVKDTTDPVEVYFREVHLRLKTWREPLGALQQAVAKTPDRTEWLG